MIVRYKTSEYEPLYTLTEAENVYYMKQKLFGLVMLAIGVAAPFLLDGDATFSLLAVPMGIGLMITKQKVMMFRR